MLKAAIIYVQGSGGNLLARTLSLSEKTIAYLPKTMALEQPTTQISVQDRLKLYNNWNNKNWAFSEDEIGIWYHHGCQDFYHYEDSELWLIDQFHPAMFESELNKQVLFKTTQSWEHLIFIQWKQSSLDTIIKLAKLKRLDLKHEFQIKNKELDIFDKMINTYQGAHVINWEDMLNETTYLDSIKGIAQKLNLILDFSLVKKLWKSWKIETDKILQIG